MNCTGLSTEDAAQVDLPTEALAQVDLPAEALAQVDLPAGGANVSGLKSGFKQQYRRIFSF
jgi:hypothetical protein